MNCIMFRNYLYEFINSFILEFIFKVQSDGDIELK